jgi:hypothetical protein
MHSHIPGIPTHNFSQFLNPCLGTGPIRNTIANLSNMYDKDYWALFCLELDKYTQVESISGVPYRRLEQVNSIQARRLDLSIVCRKSKPVYRTVYNNILKSFYTYILDNINLKYNYIRGNYSIGSDFTKFSISISNIFIAWYNNKYKNREYIQSEEDLIRNNILCKRIYKENALYIPLYSTIRPNSEILNYEGEFICNFKGKPQYLQITDKDTIDDSYNYILTLNLDIIYFMYTLFIVPANILYGNYDTETESNKKIKIF